MVDDYKEICEWVRRDGETVAPRGKPTHEILGATLVFTDLGAMLPVGIGRNLSTKIAVVEALSLIGGFCDPQLIRWASKGGFDAYMDQGNFHGGYGLRSKMQFVTMIQRLRADPDTRQAVVTLWDPLHDLFVSDAHDYPCTLSLQFMIRKGKLDMHVTMRSNDVWRGLAYDAFVFSQLQINVAQVLQRPVGVYYHHANSLHLYETDAELVDELGTQRATKTRRTGWDKALILSLGWESVQAEARNLVYGTPCLETRVAEQYDEILKEYRETVLG